MPYSCARAVCTTFCHHIAGALIPIFGPDFPAECLPPHLSDYGRMVIDPELVVAAADEADRMRRLTLCGHNSRPAAVPVTFPPFPLGCPLQLRGCHDMHAHDTQMPPSAAAAAHHFCTYQPAAPPPLYARPTLPLPSALRPEPLPEAADSAPESLHGAATGLTLAPLIPSLPVLSDAHALSSADLHRAAHHAAYHSHHERLPPLSHITSLAPPPSSSRISRPLSPPHLFCRESSSMTRSEHVHGWPPAAAAEGHGALSRAGHKAVPWGLPALRDSPSTDMTAYPRPSHSSHQQASFDEFCDRNGDRSGDRDCSCGHGKAHNTVSSASRYPSPPTRLAALHVHSVEAARGANERQTDTRSAKATKLERRAKDANPKAAKATKAANSKAIKATKATKATTNTFSRSKPCTASDGTGVMPSLPSSPSPSPSSTRSAADADAADLLLNFSVRVHASGSSSSSHDHRQGKSDDGPQGPNQQEFSAPLWDGSCTAPVRTAGGNKSDRRFSASISSLLCEDDGPRKKHRRH